MFLLPILSKDLHLSSEPTVVYTLAPKALANCIAVVPIPLAPPWINIDSPEDNILLWNKFAQTVKNVSGIAADSIIDRLFGILNTWASGAIQ